MSFTRLATSKEVLDLDWHYPVAHTFKETAGDKKGGTSAVFVEQALPKTKAFFKINGDGNRRPLLVLRECVLCKGSDHALFDRRLNNEKTKLLCQWFYCVKLPPKVLDQKHPFRKLFKQKHPPHLFVSTWDGKGIVEFSGQQTQSQLQQQMIKLIGKAYEKKPVPAVKAMLRFLSEFDKYDGLLQQYEDQQQKEMLRPKPRSESLAKLNARIDKTKKRRSLAMKRAKAVCDLKLKVTSGTSKAAKAGG
ncbi:MAG: hypothetical protein VX951_05700 [Planctomycetota bacterium]|nr:hypothetical protein [Planctomycetota bacterium]